MKLVTFTFIRRKLRKYFLTGIITIFPLTITIYIISLIYKLGVNISKPVLKPIFVHFFGQKYFEILNISSFLFTVLLITFIGSIASFIISKKVLLYIESMVSTLPIIRDIYNAVNRLTQYLFFAKKKYSQVVLVDYPSKGIKCIGLLTSTGLYIDKSGIKFVSVFIPTTPNPTSGFLLFFPETEILKLNITIDEAFRMIVSGGIITPEKLKKITDITSLDESFQTES